MRSWKRKQRRWKRNTRRKKKCQRKNTRKNSFEMAGKVYYRPFH